MSIKSLRAERCWSQQDLAKKSGLNIRTIQRLEQGQQASFRSVRALSEVFGTSWADIESRTAMSKTEKNASSNVLLQQNPTNRLYFLDNLRTFLIFLVVLYHSGGVYESSGLWGSFWLVDDSSTNNMVGLINLVIDIFVMSTIFFISGFFTPSSLKNKSNTRFIKTKFNRLMVPWLVGILTLVPLYKVIFLYSRGLPQQDWTSYFHFSNDFIGQSWLWFLPILFAFNLLYLLMTKIHVNRQRVTFGKIILLMSLIGIGYSFVMGYFEIRGWTKTAIFDFQNERIVIYLMMFVLGSVCFKLKIFEGDSGNKRLYTFVNCTAWLPVTLYLGILIFSLVKPGEVLFSNAIDQLLKWTFFHLSLMSITYALLIAFKNNFNTQGTLSRVLSRCSYNVYIIHTIIIGIFGLLLLNIEIPSLAKFALLTLSTYIVSNIVAFTYQAAKSQFKNH